VKNRQKTLGATFLIHLVQWRQVGGMGEYAPRVQKRGGTERGCGNFSATQNIKKIEAGMGMEGQIMCIEQCTFQMSSVAFLGPQNATTSLAVRTSPQTPLGELTSFPRSPS